MAHVLHLVIETALFDALHYFVVDRPGRHGLCLLWRSKFFFGNKLINDRMGHECNGVYVRTYLYC